jgi:hypothetical protein
MRAMLAAGSLSSRPPIERSRVILPPLGPGRSGDITFGVLARFVVATAVLAGSLGSSSLARAQGAVEPVEAPPERRVEIVVVGTEPDFDAVRATLGPNAFDGATVLFSRATRLDTTELLERRSGASELGVRAWVDLSDRKSASLYFADRSGERFLVRAVALPEGMSPLGREALGQVLELSVRALLEDARVGMSRAETSELLHVRDPAPEKPAPPADVRSERTPEPQRTSRSSLGAEVFYGARIYSSEATFVHGPGLGLAWITDAEGARGLLWVTGKYDLPAELSTPEVNVEWSSVRVEGGVGYAVPAFGSNLFAGGRLGVGADFTSFTPRAGGTADEVTLEPAGVSTTPVVTLAFEGIAAFERAGASLRLFASFYPVRVHYDIAVGDERREVLAPYWIRPGIELSLHLH